MKQFLPLILLVLLIPTVLAKEGSIKMLGLSELSNGSQIGIITDLTLEINQGKERVFLDTFPLTKIATQISMRFAQQIACNKLDVDCSKLDFFYTIKSTQGTVGGPSAGAAAAILTGALLTNELIDRSITITGTINSGGLIGPVGSIKQKIESAGKNGLKKVLIPRGTRMVRDGNKTLDLVEYGATFGLEVSEVATFEEAFEKFTGRKQSKVDGDLVIEKKYKSVMKKVAEDICQRSGDVVAEVRRLLTNESLEEQFINSSNRADDAFAKEEYYAAASYCFRTNLLLKQMQLQEKKPSRLMTAKRLNATATQLKGVVVNLSQQKLETITDLQTYMAVAERLVESQDALKKALAARNNTLESANYVVYAEERLGSALAWSRFFENDDIPFEMKPADLKQSCMHKVSEAEERYSYVKSVLPVNFLETRKEIDRAYVEFLNESYAMCLYRASKAKASSDAVLSVVGVEEKQIDDVLRLKLDVVKNELIKSQQNGIFSIIGYSYYEYARSLQQTDKSSALLFAEYALELTNLDVYFKRKKIPFFVLPELVEEKLALFAIGLIVGIVAVVVAEYLKFQRNPKLRRRS